MVWTDPLEFEDPRTGRRVAARNLQTAASLISVNWRWMDTSRRARAYRMMVVEANGGSRGIAKEAVKDALESAGLKLSGKPDTQVG